MTRQRRVQMDEAGSEGGAGLRHPAGRCLPPHDAQYGSGRLHRPRGTPPPLFSLSLFPLRLLPPLLPFNPVLAPLPFSFRSARLVRVVVQKQLVSFLPLRSCLQPSPEALVLPSGSQVAIPFCPAYYSSPLLPSPLPPPPLLSSPLFCPLLPSPLPFFPHILPCQTFSSASHAPLSNRSPGRFWAFCGYRYMSHHSYPVITEALLRALSRPSKLF